MSLGLSIQTQQLAGTAAMTAGVVQTQVGATPLTAMQNKVTVGLAADGVIAPALGCGSVITIVNLSAAAPKVYPPVGGTLNGGAINAGVSLTASKNAMLVYSSALDAIVIQAA